MAVPTIVSKTIGSAGLLTMVWSEAAMNAVGTITVANTYRGLLASATYVSGSGTTSLVYTLDATVYAGETVTISYPAGVVVSVSTGDPNGSATAASVTNSSAVTPSCSGPASGMMSNTCTIYRGIPSQSAASAEALKDWGVAYAGVCCAVQADGGSESERSARATGEAFYRVYFPPGTDVKAKDRLGAFTGSETADDFTLEVRSHPLDHAGRKAYAMVLARTVVANA